MHVRREKLNTLGPIPLQEDFAIKSLHYLLHVWAVKASRDKTALSFNEEK